ncbi:PAS domain-containing protein [Candidatus Rhodobacter oscarellae]|nr:PAS domain-containing protein [Candidatus Rhodobacter lobularis]
MEMKFPAIKQVDAYWEGLRDGRLMPNRAEVDPRGLENALEFALMLEMVAPGVARIRVAGMHLSDILGMEVRGMPLTAFFEPAARGKVADILQRVSQRPEVAEVQLSSPAGIGRPAINARLYLAPLSNEGRGGSRLLGCLQSHGGIGRTPRRFTVADVHTRRIVAAAGAKSFDEPQSIAPKTKPELAEAPSLFQPAPDARLKETKHPHLKLVKSD